MDPENPAMTMEKLGGHASPGGGPLRAICPSPLLLYCSETDSLTLLNRRVVHQLDDLGYKISQLYPQYFPLPGVLKGMDVRVVPTD